MPRAATTTGVARRAGVEPRVISIGAGIGQEVVIPITDAIRRADAVVIRVYDAVGGCGPAEVLLEQFGLVLSVTARAAASLPPGMGILRLWH